VMERKQPEAKEEKGCHKEIMRRMREGYAGWRGGIASGIGGAGGMHRFDELVVMLPTPMTPTTMEMTPAPTMPTMPMQTTIMQSKRVNTKTMDISCLMVNWTLMRLALCLSVVSISEYH